MRVEPVDQLIRRVEAGRDEDFPCRFPGCQRTFGSERGRDLHEPIHDEVRTPPASGCDTPGCVHDRAHKGPHSVDPEDREAEVTMTEMCLTEGCNRPRNHRGIHSGPNSQNRRKAAAAAAPASTRKRPEVLHQGPGAQDNLAIGTDSAPSSEGPKSVPSSNGTVRLELTGPEAAGLLELLGEYSVEFAPTLADWGDRLPSLAAAVGLYAKLKVAVGA